MISIYFLYLFTRGKKVALCFLGIFRSHLRDDGCGEKKFCRGKILADRKTAVMPGESERSCGNSDLWYFAHENATVLCLICRLQQLVKASFRWNSSWALAVILFLYVSVKTHGRTHFSLTS